MMWRALGKHGVPPHVGPRPGMNCLAVWASVEDRGPRGPWWLGSYRCAEVAAAGTALVFHHATPMVLTQHQEWCLVGRAHQLVLDHAVCAPAQLQSDKTRVSDRAMRTQLSDPRALGHARHGEVPKNKPKLKISSEHLYTRASTKNPKRSHCVLHTCGRWQSGDHSQKTRGLTWAKIEETIKKIGRLGWVSKNNDYILGRTAQAIRDNQEDGVENSSSPGQPVHTGSLLRCRKQRATKSLGLLERQGLWKS